MVTITEDANPRELLGKKLWVEGEKGAVAVAIYEVIAAHSFLGKPRILAIRVSPENGEYGLARTIDVHTNPVLFDYHETKQQAQREYEEKLDRKIYFAEGNLNADKEELEMLKAQKEALTKKEKNNEK